MKENLENYHQHSNINDLSAPNIVGSFHIRKHLYVIIILEGFRENFTDFEFNCLPLFSQGVKVGQFEAHGQRFAIVEVKDYQSNNKLNIADILTERELQIVKLVAHGNVNKQIAGKLHISEWTVSTHIRRIFAKLGVDSRAAMVYKCASLVLG
ncbi:MAG: helix-turn-helix transcriptional regulator [Okeania sp. SIO2C2]|uniref:response regulator transcription factor n=1 Tax=Okeania sp. SIO2C2 TaxID=2607787 RepID=UPI0013BA06BA|nr:helix-turn-helix transcriptional regulator [Okeania sp. SIO2C2]NEP86154.1 helix-turn-helix transcriptional regulator [Okeania sp. SIO2C2]